MKRYFKGWYFKAQNEKEIVAVIPAMHIEKNGKKTASVQIITEKGTWCVPFSYEQFSVKGKSPKITVGDNVFTKQRLHLKISTDEITARGDLKFGPLNKLAYDIMGPFCALPLMECRHSVCSMSHSVNGELQINGEKFHFDRGVGYIEGDRGRSFPVNYAWTQCNFGDVHTDQINLINPNNQINKEGQITNSLMLSVAKIPWGPFHFTGIIGAILYEDKEYRIGTYLGAKLELLDQGEIVIRQGDLEFTAKLIEKKDAPLYAPVDGCMKRRIGESLACRAFYELKEYGETIFTFETPRASFEYEYDD